MPLTYDNDTPKASQTIAATQEPIRTNFESIRTIIENDHNAFASSVPGTHLAVRLNAQGSAPDPTPLTATDQVILFTKQDPLTSTYEIFLNPAGDYNPPATPPTARSITSKSPLLGGSEGWAFLPCGILMKWGKLSKVTGTVGEVTVAYPATASDPKFSNPSEALYIGITPVETFVSPFGRLHYGISSSEFDKFEVVFSNAAGVVLNGISVDFYYFVMGIPA